VRAIKKNVALGCGAIAPELGDAITGGLSAGTGTELTGCGTTLCIVGATMGCERMRKVADTEST
jgi:hypothetical protein